MTDALKVVPSPEDVRTGVRDNAVVAHGLRDVLADTYRLTIKTHAYHWNVTGPLFYSLHKLTEGQYEELFAATDVIAERIRALGHLAPMCLSDITDNSRIADFAGKPSAGQMVEDLAADHEKLAHRLHALVDMAEAHKDPVTADLATQRSAVHEQAVWMLRAILAD